MSRFVAVICSLLFAGLLAPAEATPIHIGYVIVVQNSINSSATLALVVHTGPGRLASELTEFPVLTSVAITSANAKLYKDGTPDATPDKTLSWTDSPMVVATSDYNPKAGGNVDTFDVAQDYTRAIITFRINPVGIWNTAAGAFSVTGAEDTDFMVTMLNPTGLNFANSIADYAALEIPGELAVPEPATLNITLAGFGFLIVAGLGRKKI